MRGFFFEPFHLPAMSMYPNYNKGDYIVISKFGYGNYGTFGMSFMHTPPSTAIQRGDVIVFTYPRNQRVDYLKRVIGLPKDKITYQNKTLIINGKTIVTETLPSTYQNESLMRESSTNASWLVINRIDFPAQDFEITVPASSYFVMGDNRDNSNDSRYWGPVPAQNIKGKVIYSTGKPIEN